ncbi:twin-arginine translocase TatA/TatE family subunit [uncultured Actinomyces sp.]|uniref:twin-arginine translocase TatA/TatE family subunit n=1 Tax=uncultured Actinomyces sp. TaxID=249061 RepID=UPI0028E3BA07|nr:twin-arginine translocase TatA/TatE family subunit [uncultured Actinomyces sp.]
MFGINGNEFIVILLVAVIVVGPRRLPEYTRKLTQLIRQLRVFLEQAKAQIAEEVGPELGDLNLADLNPRNYDPRKIVRDALGEDLDAIKRDLANPLAAVASTAKEASDAVAADVRALAAQERSDSLGKRIEAQAEAARAGSETAQAGAESEAAQGAEADAEEAGATSAQAKEAQGAEAAQGTRAESETAQAGTEAAQGAEVKAEEAGATSAQAKEAQGTGTGVEAEAVRTEAQEARGAEAAQEAEVADVARGSEPGTGEEPMSDTTSQSGSAETASAPQAEVLQKQAAAPNDREQDAVVTGSWDGQTTATSEAAAIPTSLTEASGDLPPRPLSPRDIVRAAKAAARTRPEAATLTVDA